VAFVVRGKPRNLEPIEECQRQLDGDQLAVGFRNRTWFEGKHERATLRRSG
jgi:uncharacterized protein YecE (DUF72 family)